MQASQQVVQQMILHMRPREYNMERVLYDDLLLDMALMSLSTGKEKEKSCVCLY